MQRGPQVDDVALLATAGVEAVEGVAVQVDAEGAAASIAAVDRAGTALLRAGAAPTRGQSKVIEHACDGKLPCQVREVNPDAGAIDDRRRGGYSSGAGRGDLWPNGLMLFSEARGLLDF